MSVNTPEGTGGLTLDQGVAHLKAKMAETGATAADTAIVHAPDPNEDELGGEYEALDQEADGQEIDTENVSEGESEAEQQEPDTRPIILPDGTEITAEEARKGYLRQSDYTRKSQAREQEYAVKLQQHDAAMQQAAVLYQQLASLQERPPTPDEMVQLSRTKTPEEFQQIQAYWQYKTAVMGQAQQAIQQTQAQATQARKAQAFEALNSGEYDPTWKDPKALSAGLEKVSSYLTETFGVPSETLGLATEAWQIEIAEDSRRYRELMKAKPKAALAVKGKPVPFKPGAKSTASPQSENIRLLTERFSQNPTVDNAVALQKAKSARR